MRGKIMEQKPELTLKVLPTCSIKLELKDLDISKDKYPTSTKTHFRQAPKISKPEIIGAHSVSSNNINAQNLPPFSVSSQFSQMAAYELSQKSINPMVVLFANADHSGGHGEGQPAQEERVLQDSNASYAIPKNYQNGLNITYGGLYVISDATIKIKEKNIDVDIKVDFVFVAMPDLSGRHKPTELYYAKPENRKDYLRHITSLMILQFQTTKLSGGVIVTGRHGCGQFGNNDEDIAAVIQAVANLPEFKNDVKVVCALGRDSQLPGNNRSTYDIYLNPLKEKMDEVDEGIKSIREDIDEKLNIDAISRDMKKRYCKNTRPYIFKLLEQCDQVKATLRRMGIEVEVLLHEPWGGLSSRFQFKFKSKDDMQRFSEHIFKEYGIGFQKDSKNEVVITKEQFKLLRSKFSQVSSISIEKPIKLDNLSEHFKIGSEQSEIVNKIKKIATPTFSPVLIREEDKQNKILRYVQREENIPISDHGILVANTAIGVIVSLNIWCPGSPISPSKNPNGRDGKFRESGKFRVTDKNEQAEQMIKMAKYVFEMAKAGAAMFALQEVPLSDNENFKIFNEELEILSYEHNIENPNHIINLQFACQQQTSGSNFCTCALVNTEKLDIKDNTSTLDKKHPMLGRCGYYEIKSKTHKPVSCNFYNIHGNFLDKEKTEKFIEDTVRSEAAVVCGDSNIQKDKLDIDNNALASSEKCGDTLDVFCDPITPVLIGFVKMEREFNNYNFKVFQINPEENGLPRYQFQFNSQVNAERFSNYIFENFGIGSREKLNIQKYCIEQKDKTSLMIFTKGQFNLLKFKISQESITAHHSVFSKIEYEKIDGYIKGLEEDLRETIFVAGYGVRDYRGINKEDTEHKLKIFNMILMLDQKGYPRSEILKYIETDYPDISKTYVTSSRATEIIDELKKGSVQSHINASNNVNKSSQESFPQTSTITGTTSTTIATSNATNTGSYSPFWSNLNESAGKTHNNNNKNNNSNNRNNNNFG